MHDHIASLLSLGRGWPAHDARYELRELQVPSAYLPWDLNRITLDSAY